MVDEEFQGLLLAHRVARGRHHHVLRILGCIQPVGRSVISPKSKRSGRENTLGTLIVRLSLDVLYELTKVLRKIRCYASKPPPSRASHPGSMSRGKVFSL